MAMSNDVMLSTVNISFCLARKLHVPKEASARGGKSSFQYFVLSVLNDLACFRLSVVGGGRVREKRGSTKARLSSLIVSLARFFFCFSLVPNYRELGTGYKRPGNETN